MFRFRVLAVTATLAVLALPHGASAESYTTRIETRPFYGATVTLEEGVRVFRPLPPDRHVIINPGARTPLSLNETNVYEHRVIHNYNYDQGSDGAPAIAGSRSASWGIGNGLRRGLERGQYGHFGVMRGAPASGPGHPGPIGHGSIGHGHR